MTPGPAAEAGRYPTVEPQAVGRMATMARSEAMRATVLLVVWLLSVTACTSTPGPAAQGSVRAPVVVRRVEPHYPPELRAARVQGVVVVRGTVPKEGGTLRDPRVLSSDDPRLEPYALAAISRWQWQPGLQDGQPVDVEFTTWVRFSLK